MNSFQNPSALLPPPMTFINLSFGISLALNSGDYIRWNAIKAYLFIGTKADNYFVSASGHLIG